jgi:hypothetical protein
MTANDTVTKDVTMPMREPGQIATSAKPAEVNCARTFCSNSGINYEKQTRIHV